MVSSSKPPALLKFLHAIVYYPATAGMVVPILNNAPTGPATATIVPPKKKKGQQKTATAIAAASSSMSLTQSLPLISSNNNNSSGSSDGGDSDEYGLFVVRTLILCVASRTNHDVSQMVYAPSHLPSNTPSPAPPSNTPPHHSLTLLITSSLNSFAKLIRNINTHPLTPFNAPYQSSYGQTSFVLCRSVTYLSSITPLIHSHPL